MEIRQLRYFVAVAEELNFTRAAERCHISQPPLSRQIARLEQDIGVRLLERDQHSVSLTTAGVSFLDDARSVLDRLAGACQRATRAATGLSGRLTVGFGSSAAYALMPLLVRNFRASCPDVELVLKSMSIVTQIESLRAGEIDVGILRLPIFDELLSTEVVHSEGLVIAMPASHPVAQQRRVRFEDLATCEFVAYQRTRGMGYHNDLLALCRAAGFAPKIVQETSTTEGVVGIVACGYAVAVVPAAARHLRVDGVVYHSPVFPNNVAPANTVADFAVGWLRDSTSPTAAGFVAAAKSLPKRPLGRRAVPGPINSASR